jgi:hypothetical protein
MVDLRHASNPAVHSTDVSTVESYGSLQLEHVMQFNELALLIRSSKRTNDLNQNLSKNLFFLLMDIYLSNKIM